MKTKETELPSGYRLKKNGATYKIIDTETSEIVSLNYHEINYPRAKIGSHHTTLKKLDGLFVPTKIRPFISIESDDLPNKYYNENQKQIIERCNTDRYKQKRKKSRNVRSKSNKPSKSTSPLATKQEPEYKRTRKEENNNKNKNNNEDNNKTHNEDEQDIRLSKSNYILILASKISNVLKPDTEDWYIITSYDLINSKELEQIEDLDDIKNMDHPFSITEKDLKNIKRQTHLLNQNPSNKEIAQNLKNDTYSL